MLVQKNRLRKTKDIENVWKKGRTIAGQLVFLKYLKNNLENSRFGFIVSTKLSKKAVIRNRIKRQLRAIIRENLPKIKYSLDLIVVAKPEIIDKNYQEIKQELEELLEELF